MKPNHLLKRERELRGWSQARVASEIGTSSINVGRWERGISVPYPHFREKLCVLFGKDAAALGLVERQGAEEPSPSPTVAPSTLLTPADGLHDPAIPLPPAAHQGLIGRDALLAQLRQRLCGGTGPVTLALNGLPGVGKTTLATTLAYDPAVRTHFHDGILWVGLGPKPHVVELLSRWGMLLGLNPAEIGRLSEPDAWIQAIHATIGLRRMLLVIDDAWGVEEALAFKVGGPHCAYLYTTRFPHLAVQIAAHDALRVPELQEQDGVALLARFASDFVSQAPEMAQALVRSVGALPLALTLMGKYLSVQVYSGQPRRLHTAVEHLRDARARLHLSVAHSPADRHPSLSTTTTLSLQAIIAVSDQQLSEQARGALHALSLFPAKPNTFAEEAALAVCAVPVAILDELSDAGLLESNGPGRYMLHQTISDYAHAALRDQQPLARLIDYYVSFVQAHASDHQALEPERSNILTALEAAYESQRWEHLVRGVDAFMSFLHTRGLYSLAELHLKRAYEAARELADLPHIIALLLHLSSVAQVWGDYARAEVYLQEGLALARQTNNAAQIGDLLRNLGMATSEQGNVSQAETYFQEGLAIARELGQVEQMCRLLTGLGIQAAKRDEYERAEAYYEESLRLAQQIAHRERISTALLNLGWIANRRGDYQQGEARYREGLAVAEALGHRELVFLFLLNLSYIAERTGRYAQARAFLEDALGIGRQLGLQQRTAQALCSLGEVALAEEDLPLAEAYFQEGLALVRPLGLQEVTGLLLKGLGAVASGQDAFAQAETYLQEGLEVARAVGRPQLICQLLCEWGNLYLQQQQSEKAAAAFSEMFSQTPQDNQELLALALYGFARVAAARQNLTEARRQGEASLSLFEMSGHHTASEVRCWLKSLS